MPVHARAGTGVRAEAAAADAACSVGLLCWLHADRGTEAMPRTLLLEPSIVGQREREREASCTQKRNSGRAQVRLAQQNHGAFSRSLMLGCLGVARIVSPSPTVYSGGSGQRRVHSEVVYLLQGVQRSIRSLAAGGICISNANPQHPDAADAIKEAMFECRLSLSAESTISQWQRASSSSIGAT